MSNPRFRDPEPIFDKSLAELRLKTQFHADTWGLGDTERWDINLDDGIIVFSSAGLRVTATFQVVGILGANDGSWVWGWDHPSIDDRLAQDSALVFDFGERYGLNRLTTADVRCTEDEAWRFTALACHLSGASGAYRGPSGAQLIFMTFDNVEIERADLEPSRDIGN